MARIEEPASNLKNIEAQLARPRKKKKLGAKKTCGLIFFLLLVGALIIGLVAVAKTGLVTIPWFSKVFYQLPQPARVIDITESDIVDFKKGLDIKINQDSVTLKITEKELTYFLRQILASGEEPMFGSNLQVIISEQAIEIFGLLLQPVQTNVTILIVPQIDNNQLVFVLQEVKVGLVSAPPFLVDWLKDNLLADKLKDLNQQLTQLGQVSTLKLETGSLELSGQLNLNFFKN